MYCAAAAGPLYLIGKIPLEAWDRTRCMYLKKEMHARSLNAGDSPSSKNYPQAPTIGGISLKRNDIQDTIYKTLYTHGGMPYSSRVLYLESYIYVMSTFQIVLTGIFIFFIVVGVLIFASFGGLGGSTSVGPVLMWGTMDEQQMKNVIAALSGADDSFNKVTYVQKDPRTYQTELVDSFAAGKAPDLFFLTQDSIVSFADKVAPISYSSVSERTFRDMYVDEGALLLSPQGAYGLPFMLDPLVQYYNQDIFASGAIAQAPKFWEDLYTIAPKLTSLDNASNVKRSAVALGGFKNVTNAKDVLATLFLQAGDAITAYDADKNLAVVFGQLSGSTANPAESALRFYTEFSNPAKSVYSWNPALPESRKAFTAGDLGVYFGFASEYKGLQAANPNLRFQVSLLPQVKGSKRSLTFGRMTALSIPKGAANPTGALAIAEKLTDALGAAAVSSVTGLPPVQRSLLSGTQSDAVQEIFYNSAIMANAWLDPRPQATTPLFQEMIESVVSGRATLTDAVGQAGSEMGRLLSN